MIYLIGGPPRCGKSTLAHLLCRRSAIPWISTDALVQVLGAFDPRLRDVQDEDRFPEYAERLWPHLRTFIMHATTCAEHLTVEGDTFLPAQAAELAAELEIRVCFLGLTRTSVPELLANAGHNDWIRAAPARIRERMPGWILSRSELIARQCAAVGLPYIDLASGWDAGLARAERVLDGPQPTVRP